MRDTSSPPKAARRHHAMIRGASLREWLGTRSTRPPIEGRWGAKLLNPRTHVVFSALLVAAAYSLSAVINLSITYKSSPISPIWPPNTILLVALLLVPAETWWVYLLAVLGAHMLVELPGPLSLATATGLYVTNAGEAVLGAFLVRRFTDGAPWLGTLRKVTVYLVCAVVAAPVITSFGDAAVFMVTQLGGNYWLNWETRCVSDILTELTIGPALLLALGGGRNWMRDASRTRWVEAAVLSVTLLLVGVVTLGGQITSHAWAPLIVFAVLPVLFWAAVRFGVGGTSAALLGITIVATWSAVQGRGPFSANTPAETVISLQLFLIYISIPMLILAAVIDDRQRALWALRASEARYRAVVETQTEMITRYRPDTTLTFVNDATCRFDGKSREELLGTSMLADVPENEAARLQEMIEALLAQPDPGIVTIEHETRAADGSLRWQQWVNRTILDADGQVIELQGIGRDITDRKRAEEALSSSEARYRDLVESQSEMVCRYLPDSTLTFVNGAFCQMYGKPREQLIGTKFFDRMDQPARDHHTQYAAQLLARADTSAADEHEFTLPDGTVMWQQWVDHTIRDAQGNVIEIQSVGRDVTDRKRAEEALRESEARYRAVVRSLPQTVVLLFDANLRHSFADGPGLQLLGLTPGEVEGRTVGEAFPECLAAALAPHYEGAHSGQKADLDVEYAQHIYRIQVVPMPTSPAPMPEGTAGPAQTPVGMVVLRDITEQRRARDELVRERTLTAWLGALSHEFRTLAEHSPDFIGRLDPSRRLVYINQAGAELLGLPAEQCVGKTFAELDMSHDTHDVYAPWSQAFREVITTCAPRTFDAQVQTAGGQWRSLHTRYIPELGDDGALQSVLAIATDVSALKQAEALLAEQASELESIFEAQADGVGVYDLQGRFVRANSALRALLGLDADAEYTGLPFEERARRLVLYDEQGEPLPLAQWPQWRVLRGEILAGASAMESGVRTLDGRDLWISITGAPMHASDGQTTGVVLIARDVTARRALERQVTEQAAELEAIFEAKADGVAVFDGQGRFVRANSALRALLGLDANAAYTTLPLDERARLLLFFDEQGHALSPEQWPHWRVQQGEILAGASAMEGRVRTLDGRELWISTTGAPVYGPDGQVSGMVLITRDVTARRALERQVAEQERQFRTLVENSPDVIARYDRNLRYLYINPAIARLSTLPPEQYLGKTNQEVGLPETTYGAALQAIEEVFRTGQSHTLLEDDAFSQGSENAHYYRAQILPEFAENGTVESVLTVTTEISELKRAEAALRAANASIEAARQEEERRKRIAESLRDVLSILNSTRSPHDILSYIVSQVGELLGGEAAVIYGQDGLVEGTLSEVPATTAVTAFGVQAAQGLLIDGRQPCPQEHLPFAESAVKYALTSERPVALLDASALPSTPSSTLATTDAVSSDPDRTTGTAAMPLLHGAMPAPYRALLVVPIRVHDAAYGCLLLFYAQPYVFAPEEVALARTYADQVALAIGNARLQAHIEREAAAAERTRLAHELHDTVTQEMYSAVLLAESITRNWQGHRAEAELALQQLPEVIRGALAGLRTLLFELRPATLEQIPLSALLRQLGEAMSTRADVPIDVRLQDSEGASSDVEPSLPPAVKVVFYRVAQEALMNAAKFARAHAIRVQLRTRGRGTRSTIELEIADDGRGFDPSAIAAGHFGLAIMRERAHAVGALVQIRSQPGQGTQIVAVWPRERGRHVISSGGLPEAANGNGRQRQPTNGDGRQRHRKLEGGTA